ncbi:MAG: hypothetical protein ACK2UP_05235 [Candidatus Promineifilaceae bacterium]|jgi:hypothetical protein
MNALRVSVATYNQVVFPHPENGATMLALERKAAVLENGRVSVLAQPFGGGVKLLAPKTLQKIVGEIRFDSERSEQEQDFRILIEPSQWEAVRQYCLLHLQDPNDPELESAPERELVEEFAETLGVDLKPSQYTVAPMGFVLEDHPVRTDNWYARGVATVRVYRIYRVAIVDGNLCQNLVATSQQDSDEMLGRRALENGTGRANSVLALPLDRVRKTFLALPPAKRFHPIEVDQHKLAASVLAVLEDIEVPQYLRW